MATEVVRLGPGKHTIVAVGGKGGVDLLVYNDDGVESGKATLRAIHVAAEVGKADVRVDGKVVVTGVGLGDATGYLPVPPGLHRVAVTRPGGAGGALVKAQVRAVAGTAATAFVVGSGGMPAQVVLTEDGTAGPQTAPATGLGGATSGGAWLLILGSSLIGGSLGGATYVLARRSRSRGSLHVATPAAAAAAAPPTPSSVAAGPPVGSNDEDVAAVTETPAPSASLETALEGAVPPPMEQDPADTNGHYVYTPESETPEAPPAEDEPAIASPALWTPPPSERWEGAPASGPRFVRSEPDPEPEPNSPAPSRFAREEPEDWPEPLPAAASAQPLLGVNGEGPATPEPVAEAATDESEVASPSSLPPLRPWPQHPAAAPESIPLRPWPGIPPAAGNSEPTLLRPWPGLSSRAPDTETEPTPLRPWPGMPAPEPTTPDPAPPAAWTAPWRAEQLTNGDGASESEADPVEDAVVESTAFEIVAEPTAPDADAEPTAPDADAEPTTVEIDAVPAAPEADVEPAAAEADVEPTDAAEDHAAESAEAPTEEPASPPPAPPAVRTWSSSAARPGTATAPGRPNRVNFLVVSGAALVVTGLVVARRSGGRH